MSLLLFYGGEAEEEVGPDNASTGPWFRDSREVMWSPFHGWRKPTPMKDSLKGRR